MPTLKKYKNILIGLGVVVLLFAGWQYFFVSDEPAGLLISEPVVPAAETQNEVLNTLLEIRSLSLDPSVFASAAFRALADFSLEIAPEPIGRFNPFAPIGVGNIPQSAPLGSSGDQSAGEEVGDDLDADLGDFEGDFDEGLDDLFF